MHPGLNIPDPPERHQFDEYMNACNHLDDFEGKLPEAQHHGTKGVVDGLGEGLSYLGEQGSCVRALAPLKTHQQLRTPNQPHP